MCVHLSALIYVRMYVCTYSHGLHMHTALLLPHESSFDSGYVCLSANVAPVANTHMHTHTDRQHVRHAMSMTKNHPQTQPKLTPKPHTSIQVHTGRVARVCVRMDQQPQWSVMWQICNCILYVRTFVCMRWCVSVTCPIYPRTQSQSPARTIPLTSMAPTHWGNCV